MEHWNSGIMGNWNIEMLGNEEVDVGLLEYWNMGNGEGETV